MEVLPWRACEQESRPAGESSVSQLADRELSAPDSCELGGLPPLGSPLKVLMVWPRFPSSFWSFEGIMELIPSEANHPPLGLLTVGALCPKDWTLRLIDRSFQTLLDADILWADLVMVSGMRVQKDDIRELC